MFPSLPEHFRKHKLNADVRTLLLIRKSFDKGLIHTLGDLYLVLKGIIPTKPDEYGPYATAFYEYFLDIKIKPSEPLTNAVARSDSFKTWKKSFEEERDKQYDYKTLEALVNQFLDEVHLTSYDIKELLSGEDILNKDDPNRSDFDGSDDTDRPENITKAADYSKFHLEQLRKRMEQILKQQKRRHLGGDHWVGENGISPYGQQGGALGGLRVGNKRGGKMARAVFGDRRYYPVDTKANLSDDNIDIALASLKGIREETTTKFLHIRKTIEEGVKMGGLFLPFEEEKKEHQVKVILLIDNGGYSMTPYIRNVTRLFSKMKTRFSHDLKTYYFHNTIYGGVYSNASRSKFKSIEQLKAISSKHHLFVIGDADMGPYELTNASMYDWNTLKEHFPKMVWLNPTAERIWTISDTIIRLRNLIPMFPLTPEGIEKAIQKMNQQRKEL